MFDKSNVKHILSFVFVLLSMNIPLISCCSKTEDGKRVSKIIFIKIEKHLKEAYL